MGIILSEGRAVSVLSTEQFRLREAVTEVSRAIEDQNWVSMSTDWRSMNGNDDTYEDRRKLLTRIRMYRRRNPLAKHAAGLLQHYVIGQGISTRAENKKVVAKLVDEHWNDSANQSALYSHAACKKFLDDIYTDGEVFIVLFTDDTQGTCQLSTVPPDFVDDIIYDEKNHLIPKWYKVSKPKVTFSFRSGQYETTPNPVATYYRDWKNDDPAPAGATMEQGVVYHVYMEKRGKRGESQMLAALDWLKAHREFMEDRATINRAASQVAWKKKRLGGANDVAAEVAKIRSTLTQTLSSYEGNPPPASGSTIIENPGTNLEWVKTDTGGQAALADERILRMMSGAGMGGIPNHYFGDEANANLATATAMELPLLKTYEDWQQLVRDVVGGVLDYMLTVANKAGRVGDRDDSRKYAERVTTQQAVANTPEAGAEVQAREAGFPPADPGMDTGAYASGAKLVMIPKKASAENVAVGNDSSGAVSWYIDIDFPPILQKDLVALTTALKQLFDMLPAENIESQKLVIEMFLSALGVNDIDQEMERLFPADMVAVLVPKPPPMLPGMPGQKPAQPAVAGPPAAQSKEVASLAEVRVRRLLRLAERVDDVAGDVVAATG